MSTVASGLASVGNVLVSGIAVDANGTVYIVDANHSRVLKETFSSGSYVQSTVGTNLSVPVGVAVDGHGNASYPPSRNRLLLPMPTAPSPTP